jgi:hypothetical protein
LNVDVQTLGSLGEFIGSVAVLATLVYLAAQTRQSAKMAAQRTHSDIIGRRQELQLLVVRNADFHHVLTKAMGREQMDSEEAQRFTSYMMTYLAHTQDTYMQYKAGLIPIEAWEADVATISPVFTQPGFLDWWEHGQQYVTQEFAEVISNVERKALVLYDPETQSWGRPASGLFGRDAT